MDKLKYSECENCQDWNGCVSHCMDICMNPIHAMEEFNQYRSIGTLDECREAREKQKGKKPITYAGTNRADCSVCGATVRGIAKPYGGYCSKCGHAIDWSGEDA